MVKSLRGYLYLLSKKLNIDLHYLLKGGSFLLSTQVTSAVFGFLLTYIYARFLPQTQFGTYRYILSIYALLTIAALPGIDTALIETVSKGNDGAFFDAMKRKFKFSFIGVIFAIIVVGYHLFLKQQEISLLILFCALFLPLLEPLSLYPSLLNAQKRFGLMAFFEFLNQLVSILALGVTMYLTDNLIVLLSAYFVPFIVTKLIITLYCLKKYISNNVIDATYSSYGHQMTGYGLLTRLISVLDQMILFHVLGPIQLAVYSIALAIPMRIQALSRIVGTLALPKYAEKSSKNALQGIEKKMLYYFIGMTFVCLVYIAISPWFFKIFFPNYLDSVPYTKGLILMVLSGVTYPFGSYLVAHRHVKKNYVYAMSSIIIKLICLVVLVPRIGVWGAVWSMVLSSWSSIFLTMYFISQIKKKEALFTLVNDSIS